MRWGDLPPISYCIDFINEEDAAIMDCWDFAVVQRGYALEKDCQKCQNFIKKEIKHG